MTVRSPAPCTSVPCSSAPGSLSLNLGAVVCSLILKLRQEYLCHWPSYSISEKKFWFSLVSILTKCLLYALWLPLFAQPLTVQRTPHMFSLFTGRLGWCYWIHDRRIWKTLTLTSIRALTFTHRVSPRHIITHGGWQRTRIPNLERVPAETHDVGRTGGGKSRRGRERCEEVPGGTERKLSRRGGWAGWQVRGGECQGWRESERRGRSVPYRTGHW